MTPKRPQRLNWKGEHYPDGRPARFLEGIPTRNLTADETDALTQDQLADIRASGLYTEVAQPAPKTTARKAKNAPVAAPEAAGATEPTDAGDEPTATAETVTQGGES